MNEVLRIFDRLLKQKGYTIKKHPEYNLLPLKNFENFPAQKKILVRIWVLSDTHFDS